MDNKVIKVLYKEHGAKVIEFWKQYCDTRLLKGDGIGSYYGIINGRFDIWHINYVQKSNAEIIELPEEKTYPRVMLVSYDNIYWDKRRVVFMEKCGKFLAWDKAETLEDAENITVPVRWNYARELEPIEVTLEDIAKWKGVDPSLIQIKE